MAEMLSTGRAREYATETAAPQAHFLGSSCAAAAATAKVWQRNLAPPCCWIDHAGQTVALQELSRHRETTLSSAVTAETSCRPASQELPQLESMEMPASAATGWVCSLRILRSHLHPASDDSHVFGADSRSSLQTCGGRFQPLHTSDAAICWRFAPRP
eukprot:CAMPEP_0178409892 /NCGR_PEP_ID=MMETSP0689_2-20121128/20696_1 /TAXON_ID=160604 /ORGANISM="Amphidinium massartii, Strain CS-259" /LENGTH=157 /DNA_ID=CAMNT_0020031047 /DNA_START=1047 /DNA_END=1521 /DNA_ORIENTATION=-